MSRRIAVVERFSGFFQSSPVPAQPAAEQTQVVLPHGVLAHADGLSVHHGDGTLCVALGTPRFVQDDLAKRAAAEGNAAAWAPLLGRGTDVANSVKGRFAVLFAQDQGRKVTLITDRFGTWPLCYAHEGGRLSVSDRADRVPGEARRISPQAVFNYLYFHMIPAPTTIFEGVRRLEAGHLLEWSGSECTVRRWWNPVFDESATPDLETAKRQFCQIIEDAVSEAAQGAEVGAYLSGGTDSSTVSGMLTKVLGKPARTYSIGFDAAGYDEMSYVRIAAKHFGTEHHEYYVTPDDLLHGIPTVATHYDQPFGNSSAVPGWICAARAHSEGITRMLAGDGGDELFGGNTRYAKQRVFGLYENIPGFLRRGLIEPASTLPGFDRIPGIKKGVSYVEQAKVPMPDRTQMYNMLLRLGLDNIFTSDFLGSVDTGAPIVQQRATWAECQAPSLINRMLSFDWKYTLADNDLPKVLGTTQLAGVDVAFPLLTDELTDFSLSIPPEWKLKGFTLRWFFKEALRGFLPDAIIAKKKHGFGLPFGIWACQHRDLKALASEALDGMSKRGYVQPAFIRDLLDTHLPEHPGYYGEMVWILMMLEFWLRAHEDAR